MSILELLAENREAADLIFDVSRNDREENIDHPLR